MVTTNDSTKIYPIPEDYETDFVSQMESILSGNDGKCFDCVEHDFIQLRIVHD